jgi:hypothetical protein
LFTFEWVPDSHLHLQFTPHGPSAVCYLSNTNINNHRYFLYHHCKRLTVCYITL